MRWYALQIRTQSERIIQESPAAIAERIQFFHPTTTEESRRGNSRVSIERPLFAGYLFARFDALESGAIVESIAGVYSIVRFDGVPAAIPDEQIEAVRTLLKSGRVISPCPYVPVHKGDRVAIKFGESAGLEGTVVELRGKHALFVVSVQGLNQSLSIVVTRDQIRPVAKAADARTNGKVITMPTRHELRKAA
jgi:transcriptional antiterminator RfaH